MIQKKYEYKNEKSQISHISSLILLQKSTFRVTIDKLTESSRILYVFNDLSSCHLFCHCVKLSLKIFLNLIGKLCHVTENLL